MKTALWAILWSLIETAPYQRCKAGERINLLQTILTDRGAPISKHGVSIVREPPFDESGREITGFVFTEESRTLSTSAQTVLNNCTEFPAEWSLLITFKPGEISSKSQYLLTLLEANNKRIKLAIRLHWDLIYIDYFSPGPPPGPKRKDYPRVKLPNLHNGHWHTLIVTVVGNVIQMHLNCQELSVLGFQMPFPKRMVIEGDRFYVASRRRRKERFSGMIRQIKLSPGMSIANLMCDHPSPHFDPNLAEERPSKSKRSHAVVLFEEDNPLNTVCSGKKRGHMLLSKSKKFSVCDGIGWHSLTSAELRHIEDYDDIYGFSKTYDIETFKIDGEGYFFAMAMEGNVSSIYKLEYENGIWLKKHFQEIPTKNALKWKFFAIDRNYYLAVANFGNGDREMSRIYKWNWKKRRFTNHQAIQTQGARSWEFFRVKNDNGVNEYYLVVANSGSERNQNNSKSKLYSWDKDHEFFDMLQKLDTQGNAWDWEHFELDGTFESNNGHYLIAANHYNGYSHITKSPILKFDKLNRNFVPIQYLQTHGASDWRHFKIENRYYLAVANYGGEVVESSVLTNTTTKYHVHSQIYEYNEMSGRFERLQDILTHGIMSWEFFTIGSEHYLMASNTCAPEESTLTPESVLYKWKGVENFVPVHKVPARGKQLSTDWEYMNINGDHLILNANAETNRSKIYKIITK